ncbi:MAG: biotin--[acetyl-CoA-carboxylase] ligase [Deltaproteobacteria bacterium]|nr:MAG: biotin--[acetyl-CoA-carboxylase] ligase [Deltaproteobacteria bacterium]
MTVARWLGAVRHELDRCASTNDEADRLARAGAPHGAVVTAREQTAGRGRAGRSWYSPPGDNLYLSVVLRPPLAPRDVPPIALAAGVGVCDAVNAAGVPASVKWPNDVLVDGHKIAGVLAEASCRGERIDHVVLGIGVNVNGTAFPGGLRTPPTSLRLALGGTPVDLPAFRDALLAHLERWLDRLFSGGVAAIAEAWCTRCPAIGRPVVADGVAGVARGLDADGALIVDTPAGPRRVVAGDVEVAP